MAIEYMTVEQVAQALGLHTRTIRRFIRERRLKAAKVGRQWRILRSDLGKLTGEASAASGQGDTSGIQASAVADIRVRDEEEASRIGNTMLAAVTGKGPEYGAVQYESMYFMEERKVRLLFWGDAAFIGRALVMLDTVRKGRNG